MEEIFNDQLSFADLDADKYLEFRRSHADRRINAMDRLDDRLVDELVLICRPYYHSKARSGRPYLRGDLQKKGRATADYRNFRYKNGVIVLELNLLKQTTQKPHYGKILQELRNVCKSFFC